MNTCTACEAYQNERAGLRCPDHRGIKSCFDCGDYMEWNKTVNAWECSHCEMYIEDDCDAFDFISSEIN